MNEREIEDRIGTAFPESKVSCIDMTGGGNHFELRLNVPELEEESRVVKHQKVMGLFSSELKSGEVHALSIKFIQF